MAKFQLTAYTQNTSSDEVLDMIALSLEIGYRKKGNKVIWREKGIQPKSQSKNIPDTITTKD